MVRVIARGDTRSCHRIPVTGNDDIRIRHIK
jgi:hypothetical protein